MRNEGEPTRAGSDHSPPRPAAGTGADKQVTIRLLIFAAGYLALVVLGVQLGSWVASQLQIDIHHSPETDAMWHGVVLSAFIVYVVLMMIPFVPGVEIGLALLVVFGRELALLVYVGAVLALVISFLIGRLVPERALLRLFEHLRLRRAHALAARFQSVPGERRLEHLLESTGLPMLSWLLRFRFVALAIALNVPGNAIVGGGGGIAMAAGMSRLFSVRGFTLTLAIAAAPVPLMVALNDLATS